MEKAKRLEELKDKAFILDYKLSNVSCEGVVDSESPSRNRERLVIIFSSKEKLVMNTFCSGCNEDTLLVIS